MRDYSYGLPLIRLVVRDWTWHLCSKGGGVSVVKALPRITRAYEAPCSISRMYGKPCVGVVREAGATTY